MTDTTKKYEDFDIEKFKAILRKLIVSRGLMVKDVAADIDMVPSSLSRYLTGSRTPEVQNLIKFANYFDVSIEYILGLGEDKVSNRQVPPEVIEFYKLYCIADAVDRKVIETILSKYK